MATPVKQQETALAIPARDMFPVLSFDQSELTDLIADNLGAGMLPKLQRITWPTGGNTTFDIETDEGTKNVSTITGLVVHHIDNRLFWQLSFDESGGGAQPDCQSPDGIHGYGTPSDPLKTQLIHPMLRAKPEMAGMGPFSCQMCPLSKFQGDDIPRCKQRHPLFMVLKSETPDDVNLLPVVLSIPTASLGVWTDFSGRLLQKGISFRRAIIEVSLITDMGGPSGKIKYSKLAVRRVGLLSREEFQLMREYAEALRPLFERFRNQAVDSVPDEESFVEASVRQSQTQRQQQSQVSRFDDVEPMTADEIDDFVPIQD